MPLEARGLHRGQTAAELPVGGGLVSSFGFSLQEQPFTLALMVYRVGFP